MRSILTIILILVLISCQRNGNTTNKAFSDNNQIKTDTIKYYWSPDYETYTFDTILNETEFLMKTYCLNDSSVYNETFSEKRSKNKNLIEFSVAHNFATDFSIINNNGSKIDLRIQKEDFKDSIPPDLYKICHMWKNEFSYAENGQIVYRAIFGQPDTDYQMAIYYTINDIGVFKIIRTKDESFNGSEDE
jgi:hypothetical protein